MSAKRAKSPNTEQNSSVDADTAGPDTTEATTAATPRNWMTAVILLLLREWSSYGYDLMERMAAFGFAAMNPGSLYRVLRQLEKDGMVISAWDTTGQGPARRMYSITEAGEAYLGLWASGIEQYRSMMNTFFRLYTGQPEDTDDSR